MAYKALERPLSNILNIRKLSKNHLITEKHNVYSIWQAAHTVREDLFDLNLT